MHNAVAMADASFHVASASQDIWVTIVIPEFVPLLFIHLVQTAWDSWATKIPMTPMCP